MTKPTNLPKKEVHYLALTREGKLVLVGTLALYLFVIALKIQTPSTDIFNFIVRFCGLVGTTSLFFAIIKALSPIRVSKIYRKPFTDIHHIFALLGVILLSLHPIAFAFSKSDLSVFLPRFDSWRIFWELAGRPALLLIYIATLAGKLRSQIPKYWRGVHALTYFALFFGVIHGNLIGTDFQNPAIAILFIIMLGLGGVSFVHKRIQQNKLAQRRKARKQATR